MRKPLIFGCWSNTTGPGKEYCKIIADNLSKAGWSRGCVSAVDSIARTIWIADTHRDDGKRFVVRADERLTGFIELEMQRATFGSLSKAKMRIVGNSRI